METRMARSHTFAVALVAGVAGLVPPAALAPHARAAQRPPEPQTTGQPAATPAGAPPEELRFVTTHTGRFHGRELRYTATAGETFLRDDKGVPRAAIFSFAYTMDGIDDAASRPVTFLWNGGPGSASIWLHMGTFGPRRAVVPSDARDDGAPPYTIEPNAGTVLDLTDLVFVDPVGTGFSRALGEHKDQEFWGLNEDAASVADFIRTWITEHRRWNSPKYLAGESFGTMRAAAVADILESGNEGIGLNGIVLVSQALDYEGSTPAFENFISYVTYLPTMAATAWYHRRLPNRPEKLETFLADARRFAIDEYAPALLRGSTLDRGTRDRVRARLASFTGLDETYLERADLRPLAGRFLKELRRADGVALGRIDSRYAGDDIDDLAEQPEGDPSSYGTSGAFTAALHQYMASELAVRTTRKYLTSNRELSTRWNWRTVPEGRPYEPSYPNVARRLAQAMRRNPDLRVLIASGYYDFATPFFDAELTVSRYGIVRDRVTMTYYEAGHMMYVHDPSRERFLADVRTFLTSGRPSR
jgi:carboxypeptidase C (cathepsin A)